MIFRSPDHPGAESSQELIVLSHGEARVLVPLPETYEVTFLSLDERDWIH